MHHFPVTASCKTAGREMTDSRSLNGASAIDSRVKVIREDQTLLLKRQDVTVSRLARIFKVS